MKKKMLAVVMAAALAASMLAACGSKDEAAEAASSAAAAASSAVSEAAEAVSEAAEAASSAVSEAAEAASSAVSEAEEKAGDASDVVDSGAAALSGGSEKFEAAATVDDYLANFTEQPDFYYENDIVDAKSIMAGKKVMCIPSNSSLPFVTGVCECVCDILEELGAEGFIWENNGTPDEWQQGIQTAINQGYDFVSLFGCCNPGLVAGGYQMLQDAGIPLMTAHYGAAGADIDTADWRLGVDFYEVGCILAAWTIKNAGEDAVVAVLAEYDTESGPQLVQGMQDAYAKWAPNATVEYVNVPINDWATKCQNETQNAIQRMPGIDYVVPIYDSMFQYVVPGIEMAGKTGEVKTISYNGTPFCLDLVREGDAEMDIGECLDNIAYSSVDIIIRAFDGNTEQIDTKIPHYIFTADNAADAGVPAEYGKGYGDAYVGGYHHLWGMD